MADLRFCVIGRHDIVEEPRRAPYCRRCENVFPMGKPQPFSAGGRTANVHAPRPGILPDQ